jgi:hypothetical protein
MDRLSLKRIRPQSRLWNPKARIMETRDDCLDKFSAFINALSKLDAGDGEPVELHVKEQDKVVDGPILASK